VSVSNLERHRADALRAQVGYAEETIKKLTREVPYGERMALEAAQSRYDSVMAYTGGPLASSPIPGETSLAYRQRLLKPVAATNERFKNSWLGQCDSPTLAVIEAHVYSDAVETAKRNVPPGQLKEVQRRDPAGRLISEYYGDMSVWFNAFTQTGATCRIDRDPPKKV
jgi:hypothetical protein